MDRYHLAWLMVGKPKGIVRGRPMTRRRGGGLRPRGRRAEDRGAADEPRRGRAPGACRSSGETGGAGRRPIGPDAAAATPRRALTGRSAVTRPGRRRPAGRDGAPRAGGRRRRGRSRRPTRSPATTSCSRSGSTSASRGSSTATSARPTSRPRSTSSSSAPPARLRDDAAALRERLAGEVDEPGPARLARRPARRARDAGRGPRRRARCRTSSTSTRCFASAPPRRPDAEFDAAAARDRRAAARRRAAGRPARRLGPPVRDPGRPAAGGPRLAGRAVPGAGGRRCSGCPTARTCGSRWSRDQPWSRLQLVRRRPPLAGRHQHGPAGPRRRRSSASSPTRPTRATTSSTPGRRPTSSIGSGRLEASILLINTPGVPDQRGPGRPRAAGSSAAGRRAGRPARRAVRAGRAADRRRSGRGPRGRRAGGGARRRRGATLGRDRAAMPRSCATPTAARTTRSSTTSRTVGRYRAGDGREAPRVHRAPAVADLRLRLRRGRGAARALGRRRARAPSGRRGSGACSASS